MPRPTRTRSADMDCCAASLIDAIKKIKSGDGTSDCLTTCFGRGAPLLHGHVIGDAVNLRGTTLAPPQPFPRVHSQSPLSVTPDRCVLVKPTICMATSFE